MVAVIDSTADGDCLPQGEDRAPGLSRRNQLALRRLAHGLLRAESEVVDVDAMHRHDGASTTFMSRTRYSQRASDTAAVHQREGDGSACKQLFLKVRPSNLRAPFRPAARGINAQARGARDLSSCRSRASVPSGGMGARRDRFGVAAAVRRRRVSATCSRRGPYRRGAVFPRTSCNALQRRSD